MPSSRSAGGMLDDHRRPPLKEPDDEDLLTHTLWVGSLSSATEDPDLMALFAEHGALDCTTMYSSTTYAFVYFKNLDGARAAKDALQGALLHGSHIKIEFARPAKPCKHLWIGGISLSTTKEQLEDEFLKFGKIEEYKFHRDRNSAFIGYYRTEVAFNAQKNMNGKHLAGEQIRVDFLRPEPFRRDGPDHHDSRNDHFSRSMGPPELRMQGPKRLPPYGGRRDNPLSSVLWVGYPPSVQIDEQMLHNAMILFGEIESIRCFQSRHYAFVEFRSIDEARRAKEGLEGRLFNDSRIQILFSSSEVAPKKNKPPYFPGLRGPRLEMFFNEGPVGGLELFGPGSAMAPNSFSGLLPLPGSNILMGSFAPQAIDPRHGDLAFHEFGGARHNFPDCDLPLPSTWTQQSPVPGMLPSAPGMQPPFRPMPGGWDGFDTRELKRSRIDGSAISDAFRHARRTNIESTGGHFGFPHPDRGALGQSQHNGVVPGYSQLHDSSNNDHCWRGIIAKGGTHVCRARCLPLGKGIDSPFPGIINCSARTGLDMLTKYYAEATGFDIVFFLPDSEEDFASYTEFLCYLGQKGRAGVAKLDDGTTLFFVPPSNFLSEVLNVSGPERLYGVVLKLPQHSTSSAAKQPQLAVPPPSSHFIDQQQVPDSQKGYSFVPHNEPQNMNVENNRPLLEGSMPRIGVQNPLLAHVVEPYTTQSSSQDYVSRPTSQVEVSLTPELLATLATLIPGNIQTGASVNIQMPLSSSIRLGVPSASVMQDGSMPLQGQRQENEVTVPSVSLEPQSHPSQQLGYQYSNQAPLVSQFPMYTNIPNRPDHSAQPARGSKQHVIPSQVGRFSSPQNNQPFQLDSSSASRNNYGMLQTADAAGVFTHSVQQSEPNSSSAHAQAEYRAQPPQIVMSLPTDQVSMGFPTQEQPSQTVLSGLGQGTSEGDADKNQRYQSTLQFAANLLLRLQQQQQASGQAVQGSENQQ